MSFKNNNYIFLLKKIIRKYFNRKQLLLHLIFGLAGIALVLICAIPMHVFACHAQFRTYGNGFINIEILTNPGVSFGMFSGNTILVNLIQWVISLIILFVFFFARKWYLMFFLSLAYTGGFFNAIDRLVSVYVVCLDEWKNQEVIDYFHFSFGKTSWNFPDVFIITGIIGTGVLYTITSLIKIEKKQP